MKLSKFRIYRLKTMRSLSTEELNIVKSLNKEKKKWTFLEQILFWVSMIFVFFGSFTILLFFLDLYTLSCVISNKITLKTTYILMIK